MSELWASNIKSWVTYGQSTGDPRVVHEPTLKTRGRLVGDPWATHGPPLEPHGWPMDQHRRGMGYLRVTRINHGRPMG